MDGLWFRTLLINISSSRPHEASAGYICGRAEPRPSTVQVTVINSFPCRFKCPEFSVINESFINIGPLFVETQVRSEHGQR